MGGRIDDIAVSESDPNIIYYGLLEIFKAMKEIPEKIFGKPFDGASISLENNPALLGVGYIIGPRISALMMAGGVLSYLVLIPAIKFFGSAGTLPLAPETAHTIAEMSVELQSRLLRFLETGEIRRVGANRNIAVSTLVVAATNRDRAALERRRVSL